MSKSKDQREPKPKPGKKRRWLRRLVVLCVLLVALGFAVNGPIARWAVGRILTKQLAKQGLEGKVTVEGQLWSGFTLKEAEFDGGTNIVRLKFDELGVHYTLPELKDKKIRRVHGRGLEIVINPKVKGKPEPESIKPEFNQIAETLRKVRPLLTPLNIELERFDLTLNRSDKEPLRFTFNALSHAAGDPVFKLRGFASNLLGERGLPSQDLTLTWTANQMHLGPVEVLPALALREATITYPDANPVSVAATVQAGGAELDLAADETGMISLTMDKGPLQVNPIIEPYNPDLVLDGTISRLQVTARNLWDGTDTWTARVELDGTDLKWPGGGELAKVSLRLTGDQNLALTLSAGQDLELKATAPRPVIKDRPLGSLWKDLLVTLDLRTPSLHQTLRDVFVAIGAKPLDLTNIPEGAVVITGDLTTGGQLGIAPTDLKWSLADVVFLEKSVPDLNGTAGLKDGAARLTAALTQPRPEESLQLTAGWILESKTYNAELVVQLPDPSWIDPFLPGESPDWRPTGPLAVTWKGQGSFPPDAEPTHTGQLQIAKLTLTAPENTTTGISLEGTYAWPSMVELTSLSVRNEDLWLEGAVKWAEERLIVRTLRFHDQSGPLAHLEGSLPLTTETLAPKDFFAQKEKIDLTVDANDLRLRRLAKLLPLKLPDGFTANLSTKLTVTGTPSDPLLGGTITATEVDTPGPEKLPPLAATLQLSTVDRILKATGEVTEPGGRVVSLDASLPLQIDRLLNDPDEFKKLPIEANATISKFALQRLQILAPPLAKAVGTLDAEVRVRGTMNAPELAGGATVTIERYPLPGTPLGELGKSVLVLRLDGDRIAIDSSPFTAAGGTVVLAGTVGLADGDPQLDLQLTADSALVWRDDNVLVRTNGQLTLQGPLKSARLRGELGIIESLVYKDIEILPLGVPATGAPKPKLPKFDRATTNRLAGIPEPFKNWTLDVGITTTDPILIRGNIATGRITAAARIGGTIGEPRPQGSINLDNAQAVLPLSKLTVRDGKINLRPNFPFDPVIDVRGTTVINNHRISIYLFGPLSDPKYDLFSDPPLPESEILTLIATGTTTGGLQDRDTATMKAFQFGVNELKRRLTKPGSDSLLQKFLTTLEVVDVRVGENDPFQGRKFTSATLQLNSFLFFSAAVDKDGQTRGVIMYSPQPDDEEGLGLFDEPGGPEKDLPPSKIRVVGLRSIEPDKALGAIAGRLEYITDRPANASRANDAAFLLERFLEQEGFTESEVAWNIPQPGQILLTVKEGPRSSLGKIYVQGVTGELFEGVREQMQAAHQGKSRLPGSDIPYLPENNATGLTNATDLLHSEGYWGGVVSLAGANRDPRTGRTDLQLRAIPGPRYQLATVEVEAGSPLRKELVERLQFLRGRVAKTENITLARNSVSRYFRDKGYQNAKVFMRARHEAGLTHLSFRVTLGKLFRVDGVEVVGLVRTKQEIVERRFAEYPGTTYSREEFDDEIRKLFGTGAFAGIRLEERPQPDGSMDVTLHMREGKPDGYQIYLGAGSFEGYILGAGYYHRNLFGNLWNLSTRAELTGIGLLGEASVTDPFFLGHDLRFTPRAFILTRTYEGYKKFESGAGVQLAWDVNDHWTMALDWTTSLVTLTDDGLPPKEIGPETYLLNVLGLTQIYDRRNDVAVPTDGYYGRLSTDVGLSLGEGAISFARGEARVGIYEPVTKKSHVAVGARAGMIVPSASSTGLPVDLRYFLGGANSVRSFPARELGPTAGDGVPRGGESYWVANAEYTHAIVGPLNGTIFLDAGSLSREHFELFSGDIKYALGLGIRLDLPIGPVRLEYGHALNPEGSDPAGAFHFAIGSAF